MRKPRKMMTFIILSLSLVLTGCDEVNALIDLVPKFSSDLPNVISGKFAYYEDEQAAADKVYLELFEFDAVNRKFVHSVAGEETESGTYSYSYLDFTILECNGYLTLSYVDGDQTRLSFKYEATAVGGPVSLTFRQDGLDRVFLYEP